MKRSPLCWVVEGYVECKVDTNLLTASRQAERLEEGITLMTWLDWFANNPPHSGTQSRLQMLQAVIPVR